MKKNISLWVGNFLNEQELEDYLLMEYLDDQELPESQFTKNFNIDYYDQDFQEAYYAGGELSIKELIEPISYSETFINQVQDKNEKYNSLIAVYKYKYEGVINKTDKVFFLGVYEYEE